MFLSDAFVQSSPNKYTYIYIYIYIYIHEGYALCRRPPLWGRALCGGGYVVLAHPPCWVHCLLVVLSRFGFPVKCAETSWLHESSFHCFFTYSCCFGHRYCYCYLGCPEPIIRHPVCLHFTNLGANLSSWGHPGDHGSSRKGN